MDTDVNHENIAVKNKPTPISNPDQSTAIPFNNTQNQTALSQLDQPTPSNNNFSTVPLSLNTIKPNIYLFNTDEIEAYYDNIIRDIYNNRDKQNFYKYKEFLIIFNKAFTIMTEIETNDNQNMIFDTNKQKVLSCLCYFYCIKFLQVKNEILTLTISKENPIISEENLKILKEKLKIF